VGCRNPPQLDGLLSHPAARQTARKAPWWSPKGSKNRSFCLTLTPLPGSTSVGRQARSNQIAPRRWHTPCKVMGRSGRRRTARLLPTGPTTSLARGASDECDTAVALPLTAVSSQNVIGSFEARFFLRGPLAGVVSVPRERGIVFNGSANRLTPHVDAKPALFLLPKLLPVCGPKRRFSAECAGRAL
jgi:hypothetical protein